VPLVEQELLSFPGHLSSPTVPIGVRVPQFIFFCLDHLKLGLDDETAFNLPDSLTHEDIGEPINEGSTKVAYILKNHPDLLFLRINI
jgi:hypothetical protein